ncbi:MAG: hypothetical protein COU98_00905 [Candidatus Staskawiczbacteria bacterium CG10_big_fil_rev_8_21_14_0_10_38_10]|uniref:DNA polymerase III subunit delta n=1 Tax=Candidatus Staskawiczbacteria bacterium CG10_big_fil_rev_8_21_14_0_10_38_10 TaxID=1974891 RepID=A0A2H9T1S5_9BACT|nr:MAG: hypothetical protein COU98_00905 [Candidatus Staskawiczbacteria bacterium CG10_big_fil_rev_8_21_14_0_10_38_10]
MIIGHQKQWEFLKKCLELNRLSHAYLFSGLESLGKKNLAIEFVKMINCETNIAPKEPCQKCANCKAIEKRSFPDLFIAEPSQNANKTKNEEIEEGLISISHIRQAQHFLSFLSYYGKWKTVILDQAEKMTHEAQSCLLKTLEEVKGKTILILISSHPEMLLPTVYSRCQIIKFFPVSQLEIRDHLIKIGASQGKAEMLASISQGKPGKAIDFFINEKKLEEKEKFLKEFLEIRGSNYATRFQYVKNVLLPQYNLHEVLETLQNYFRYVLFLKIGLESSGFVNFPKPDQKFKSYPIPKLEKIIRTIQTFDFLTFSTNLNPKLALEVLMLEI